MCSGGNAPNVPNPTGTAILALHFPPEYYRRHHRRISKGVVYSAPTTIYGQNGSYCYMTSAPNGPTSWPAYYCWLNENDSLTFTDLWAVPLYNYITGEACGETAWGIWIWSGGGPLTIPSPTPNTTGLGNWNCQRLDIVSETFSRGYDSGGWGYALNIQGSFTVCGSTGYCSSGFDEPAAEVALWPGPPPSPLPTPVPTSTSSAWPSPGPSVGLVIYDNRLQEIVSTGLSPNPTTVIGLRDDLKAEQTDGGTPQSVTWERVGATNQAILSQSPITAPSVSNAPLPMPTSTNPIKFYFVGSGNPSGVEVTATVNGQQMVAWALYNVEAPTFGSMTATFATPGVYSSAGDWGFELGRTSPSPSAGIVSNYAATGPPDFAGYYAEGQLVQSNPYTVPTGIFQQTGSQYWDDGCWIQNTQGDGYESPAPEFSPGAAVAYGPTYDAPGYPLGIDGMTLLSTYDPADQFVDYFMFAPAVQSWPHYVWVNFGKLTWNWGGVATPVYSSPNGSIIAWALSSPIPPGPTQTGAANSDPVAWPSVYNAIPIGPSSCPSPPSGDESTARKALRSRQSSKLSKPLPRATRQKGW
jgi:hypothetical protein